jgi:hypothetical protein
MSTMTGVLTTPRPPAARRPPSPPAARPLVLSGALAAGYAAGLGLLAVTVPVLVGWATDADTGASATEAMGAAVQAWLLAHGSVLDVPGGSFGLVPLGLTLLPAALLHVSAGRAMQAVGQRDLRAAASLTAVLAGVYALVCAVLTLAAATQAVQVQPVSAFLGSALLAVAAGGSGALRATDDLAGLRARLPPLALVVLRAGLAGVVTLLAGGALLAGLSLAVHLGRAADLINGLDTGALGGVLLVMICLLYVPTAAVWGAAYALGPGFSVGVGTGVTIGGTTLGAVPGLPLLAALPAHGGGWTAVAAGLVPVVAGLVAGAVGDRTGRRPGQPLVWGWRATVLVGLGSGAVAGVVFGVLCLAATGPGGPGRMAQVGPSPWLTGLAAAVEVGTVCALTLLVRRRGRI